MKTSFYLPEQLKFLWLITLMIVLPGLTFSQQTVPGFRGKNCRGVAPEDAKTPVQLSTDNIVWKTSLHKGVSSPCIAGNKIFTTGWNAADSALITYCIDKQTGTVLWEQSVFPDTLEKIHAVGSYAAATPFVSDNKVYSYFGSYGIVCYTDNGKMVWQRKLPMPDAMYGSCASPVIVDNKLILNRIERGNSIITALNPKTGKTLWKSRLSQVPGVEKQLQRSFATPVFWKDQIIIHRTLALTSVNIEDGNENWTQEINSVGVATPVIAKDVLYLNGFSNVGEARLYDELPDFEKMLAQHDSNSDGLIQYKEIPLELAVFKRPELKLPLQADTLFPWRWTARMFDSTKDKALNKKEWQQMNQYWSKWYAEHGVVAFDLTPTLRQNRPEFLWKENEYVAEVPSLLCTDNRVYMITNGGIVTCMDRENGKVIYRERTGAPGAYIASPLFSDGHIYFASYNGKILVVEPADTFRLKHQMDLNEKLAASPVAAGDKLFIRTNNNLYAFGEN